MNNHKIHTKLNEILGFGYNQSSALLIIFSCLVYFDYYCLLFKCFTVPGTDAVLFCKPKMVLNHRSSHAIDKIFILVKLN